MDITYKRWKHFWVVLAYQQQCKLVWRSGKQQASYFFLFCIAFHSFFEIIMHVKKIFVLNLAHSAQFQLSCDIFSLGHLHISTP